MALYLTNKMYGSSTWHIWIIRPDLCIDPTSQPDNISLLKSQKYKISYRTPQSRGFSAMFQHIKSQHERAVI